MRGGTFLQYAVQCGLAAALGIGVDRFFLRSETPDPSARPPADPLPVRTPGLNPPPPPISFQWNQIESSQYQQFISNLRKIRCPEQTIRDIVIADLSELYSREWKRGLIAAKTNYWEAHYGCDPVLTDTNQIAALGMQTNLQEVVRILLGVDLRKELKKYSELSAITVDTDILLASFLPPEKVLPVGSIHEKYEALLKDQDSVPFATAESLLGSLRLLDEQQKELAALLTPAELEQWNYRFSSVAQEIRGKIADFDLSEDEFKSLYAAQHQRRKELYDRLTSGSGWGSNQADTLLGMLASAEFGEDTLKEVLGASRFAEYERSRDVQYQQLHQFARRYEIEPALVAPLYEECARTEDQISHIRDNETLSPAQKESMIGGARESRDRALAVLLGDENYQRFKAAMPLGP